MTVPVRSWKQVQVTAQWRSLLLGNGASCALHPGFGYGSLFQVAHNQGLLGASLPVFQSLGTSDFEHVLLALWHAELVNRALGSGAPQIASAYADVRDALIGAVHHVHCPPPVVSAVQAHIATFAQQFLTIVTFNYDLTFYWAMLEANRTLGTWFKDAFLPLTFDPKWSRLRAWHNAAGAALVFYGHGSLMGVAPLRRRQAVGFSRLEGINAGRQLLLPSRRAEGAAGTRSPDHERSENQSDRVC